LRCLVGELVPVFCCPKRTKTRNQVVKVGSEGAGIQPNQQVQKVKAAAVIRRAIGGGVYMKGGGGRRPRGVLLRRVWGRGVFHGTACGATILENQNGSAMVVEVSRYAGGSQSVGSGSIRRRRSASSWHHPGRREVVRVRLPTRTDQCREFGRRENGSSVHGYATGGRSRNSA